MVSFPTLLFVLPLVKAATGFVVEKTQASSAATERGQR